MYQSREKLRRRRHVYVEAGREDERGDDQIQRRGHVLRRDGPDEAEEDGEGNKSTTTGDANTSTPFARGRHPYTELFMRRYETLLKPHSTWEGATKLREGTSPGPMERGRWAIPKR